MELTAQMAALEEEVKLLKGEIKTILTEIRTAVLAHDNPFAPGGGVPVFRPVERPLADSEPPAEAQEEADDGSSEPEPSIQRAAASEPEEPPPTVAQVETPPPQARVEPVEPAASQQGGSNRPAPAPEPAHVPEPPPAPAAPARSWSVQTIAGLVAWADETASRLGAAHLQMVLELARFADLIPSDAEEPLLKVIKLASSRKDSAAASVNDCLVALRQLEAIFDGELSDQLVSAVRRPRAHLVR
jgi:hypothetical protein